MTSLHSCDFQKPQCSLKALYHYHVQSKLKAFCSFFPSLFFSSFTSRYLARRGPSDHQQPGVGYKWNRKVQVFQTADSGTVLEHRVTILSGQNSVTRHDPFCTHLTKLLNCD